MEEEQQCFAVDLSAIDSLLWPCADGTPGPKAASAEVVAARRLHTAAPGSHPVATPIHGANAAAGSRTVADKAVGCFDEVDSWQLVDSAGPHMQLSQGMHQSTPEYVLGRLQTISDLRWQKNVSCLQHQSFV